MQEQLPLDWLSRGTILTEDPQLTYSIEEFFAFRQILYISGWCRHDKSAPVAIFVILTSRIYRFSVNAVAGTKLCFSQPVSLPADQTGGDIAMGFEYSDGRRFLIEHPFPSAIGSVIPVPTHLMWANFTRLVREIGEGSVLEIGSRARSGNVYSSFVPPRMKYVGMDIKAGPNVDVVGDAHHLTRYFDRSTFIAVFSIVVFEHLLMPWKVAIELNKIMKKGGILFISTHQTFPVHEEPWDFWRFSDRAWHGLFNEYTGFEVVDAAMGERVYVMGSFLNGLTYRLEEQPAYMASTVLCKKIGDCTLEWPVEMSELVKAPYSH